MNNTWRSILNARLPLLIDGGTGSELRRRGIGLDATAWSGPVSLGHYDVLRAIHADYIRAGAAVISTNTFATHRFVLSAAGYGDDLEAINRRAVQAAQEARDASGRPVAIAGSMSCLPPRFDVAAYPNAATERAAYRELAELLAAAGVDLLALEMLQDTRHAAWLCEAAAATGLPIWLGLSCRIAERGPLVGYDLTDTLFADTLNALLGYEPAAVCVMHSPVDATVQALATVRTRFAGFIGAYPEWSAAEYAGHGAPADFARIAVGLHARGAQIIGGCCGTTPAHIQAAGQRLSATDDASCS